MDLMLEIRNFGSSKCFVVFRSRYNTYYCIENQDDSIRPPSTQPATM